MAVLVGQEGRVRHLTLNRPHRLNAIDMAMLEELDRGLEDAEVDPGVGAVLLTGAGRAFTAGNDLESQRAISAAGRPAVERQVMVLQRIAERMLFGTKPLVCAVQGYAVGGGFAWTLGCDFAIWAEGAVGFLPEIAMGLFVSGGASVLLPHLATPIVAREMLYRGRRMSAADLLAAGIASRVVPPERLAEEAMALAQELAALPPETAARAKRALVSPLREALQAALAREGEACVAGALDAATLARFGKALKR